MVRAIERRVELRAWYDNGVCKIKYGNSSSLMRGGRGGNGGGGGGEDRLLRKTYVTKYNNQTNRLE